MLNNNFSELVKKYKKYKSRQRNKIFLLLLVIVILAAGFYLATNNNFVMEGFKKSSLQSQSSEDILVSQKSTKTTQDEVIADLKPVVEVKKPLEKVNVTAPKSEELPNKIYERTTKNIKEANPFQLEVKERKSLYKLLIDDKEQNSYQSAINIAQFYFDERNYQKTITWAVKASKKDPKEALPWLLYAKSKVTLGKIKVAKKALSLYLKHTNSKEIQDLLDSLK